MIAEDIKEKIDKTEYDTPEIMKTDCWLEPSPLSEKIMPMDYPLDALPDIVRAAVEEVQAFTKAPLSMVASTARSAISIPIQALIDVKRAENLSGPSGTFSLTIADSGERKSTCDGFFMTSIREYEARKAEEAKSIIKDYKARLEAWESKVIGVKDAIRKSSKSGVSTDEDEARLRELQKIKPVPPRMPRLSYGDITPEALIHVLANAWPSAAIVSNEAGSILGSHGMQPDSIMRNLATYNALWDGQNIATDRRSTESSLVKGGRLTIALQIQEATLRHFLNRSGSLARGIGFLARFLITWPQSTQGYRLFSEAPDHWIHLDAFHKRMNEILETPIPINDDGALSPHMLSLTPEAKLIWIAFHDSIERELSNDGELYDVRDVASKVADNAIRIAGQLQVFEKGLFGPIEAKAMEGGARIALFHLNEAKRFLSELAMPDMSSNVIKLDAWLIDYCRKENVSSISSTTILQKGPNSTRKVANFNEALVVLSEFNRVRIVTTGRTRIIEINPTLLNEEY